MLSRRTRLAGFLAIFLLGGCAEEPREPEDPQAKDTSLWFFVLVKSSNYAQSETGELTRLNYHFFSEIFPKAGFSASLTGQLTRHDAPASPMPYVDRGSNYYIEGGHFDTLEALDAAFPNGSFRFEFEGPGIDVDTKLSLAGPEGETDIPEPVRISLFQDGEPVSPLALDANQPLIVRWSDYSNGAADPNGIVDDMIFVVVQDCHGERIVHTGLPFKEPNYMTFRERELVVEPGTLYPGEAHAMFVEFPHVVDSTIVDGIPGFTSFATATYLDLETKGEPARGSCEAAMPPMDTGQTDR